MPLPIVIPIRMNAALHGPSVRGNRSYCTFVAGSVKRVAYRVRAFGSRNKQPQPDGRAHPSSACRSADQGCGRGSDCDPSMCPQARDCVSAWTLDDSRSYRLRIQFELAPNVEYE
jgi:hypothetical protein